jgi:hypothetical protein
MDMEQLLSGLKIDLGIRAEAYDGRLRDRLQEAQERLAAEGITLEDTQADRDLVIMYAAWLWRRRDGMEGMPRMLRYALNNRIFAEKMSGAKTDG